MTNTATEDAAARRRAADRERKRAARAAAREARGDAEAGSRGCAHGPSASAAEEPIDLATLDGIRSTLEWALSQVQSDRTNSPTNRARVAAQIAREASALLQVHTLADRVAAIESAMAARQETNRK